MYGEQEGAERQTVQARDGGGEGQDSSKRGGEVTGFGILCGGGGAHRTIDGLGLWYEGKKGAKRVFWPEQLERVSAFSRGGGLGREAGLGGIKGSALFRHAKFEMPTCGEDKRTAGQTRLELMDVDRAENIL